MGQLRPSQLAASHLPSLQNTKSFQLLNAWKRKNAWGSLRINNWPNREWLASLLNILILLANLKTLETWPSLSQCLSSPPSQHQSTQWASPLKLRKLPLASSSVDPVKRTASASKYHRNKLPTSYHTYTLNSQGVLRIRTGPSNLNLYNKIKISLDIHKSQLAISTCLSSSNKLCFLLKPNSKLEIRPSS